MEEDELYTKAAEILRKAREKRATLKTLIYGSQYKNIPRLFALVNNCNKYKDIIEDLMSHCLDKSIVKDLAEGCSDMTQVLLYEYLLGNKFGRNVSMRKMVLQYKHEIASSVGKVLQKHKAKTLAEAAQKISGGTLIQIPRYMRVNLIKSSVEDVVEELISEEWDYVGKINIEEFSVQVKSLGKWQFGLDPLLSDLLVFPVGTDLHNHSLTTSGVLVQQDRASCVPAHVLNPAKGSVVLDCCSAPGNKTSHLACLTGNTGRVIALDRDKIRMETMSRLLERSGATCVDMIVQDFLTVHPDSDDAKDIRFILVDPSCSGSGMLGSVKEKIDTQIDGQRLQTLKRFQILILKHALRFPAVERVVYSTCSIHPEENEEVVEEVMGQVSGYFQFQPVLPDWPNSRGLDGYPNSQFFLRLSPERDLTQGFFVACFERVKAKQQPVSNNISENGEDQTGREVENGHDKIKLKKKSETEVSSDSHIKVKSDRKVKYDSQETVKSDHQVKVKSHRKTKSDSQETVKCDIQETVKSDHQETVKSDDQGTLESDHQVKVKSHIKAKSDSQEALNSDDQEIVKSSHQVKVKSHRKVKSDSQETVKWDSQETVKSHRKAKSESQEILKSGDREAMKSEHHVKVKSHRKTKSDSLEILKSDDQETVKSDHQVKVKSHRKTKSDSLEILKSDDQETVKSEHQETVKSYYQETVKSDSQEKVKYHFLGKVKSNNPRKVKSETKNEHEENIHTAEMCRSNSQENKKRKTKSTDRESVTSCLEANNIVYVSQKHDRLLCEYSISCECDSPCKDHICSERDTKKEEEKSLIAKSKKSKKRKNESDLCAPYDHESKEGARIKKRKREAS